MITGKNLLDAYSLVARCGQEITNLSELLGNMLVEALTANRQNLLWTVAGEAVKDKMLDDSGTVRVAWLYAIPLKPKGKGNHGSWMYLTFQISMMGDSNAIPNVDEPLMHVYCWGARPSFASANYVGFPLDPEGIEQMEVVEDRLLRWDSGYTDEWNRYAWTYSLRLVHLNGESDLHLHIIKPIMELLQGKNALQALPDTLPALLHYPAAQLLLSNQEM